jgi:hypothetical protein
LCFFVANGELDINSPLSPEKQDVIEAALAHAPDNFLKAVKNELRENHTDGEIKLMVAHRRQLASKQ